MMEGGEPERVLEMRRDFQRMMECPLQRDDRGAHRPQVLALLSQAQVEPDLTVETFLLDGPVSGFGALELVEVWLMRA